MKRLGSSDSLGALMSMCPQAEEHSPISNHMYSSREYQSMLEGFDEEVCVEESGHVLQKKRRLSVDQVKALERSFEVENKLEPERKVKLAQDLGLQPRQVAVWFQNRRARWKTKQLEIDYGVLKANFDALKQNYDSLQRDKDALLKEIKELKSKLKEEGNRGNTLSMKEEAKLLSGSENKVLEPITLPASLTEDASLNMKGKKSSGEFKDGQSDSDSSAILNDDHSPNASNSSSGFVKNHQLPMPFRFNSPNSSVSPSSINCLITQNNAYHPQLVKMEEHDFFTGEEAETCDFFSEEQAPTLHGYCSDQWASPVCSLYPTHL